MEKEEKEIDLLELGKKLWDNKKFILKCSIIGTVVGLIIAFSIPKEYNSKVILLPDAQTSSMSSMSSLAALAGINLQNNAGVELLTLPDFYPDIINSTPFLREALNISVQDHKSKIDTTLYSYLNDYQSIAWWTYILKIPSYIRGLIITTNDIDLNNKRAITKEEFDIIENLQERISVSSDKKTGVTTLTIKMQSPEIAGFLADTLSSHLQKYIIRYRTKKVDDNLNYTSKLFDESQKKYYSTQEKLAKFVDQNRNIVSSTYNIERERLQNEANLAYSIYNQTAQELQMTKINKQNTKPFFSVIQPAIDPIEPSNLSRKAILIIFLFLFASTASLWILRDNLKQLL